MSTNKDQFYTLHEMLLQHHIQRVQDPEASVKDIELAMRFLKDNAIQIDLTAGAKREEVKKRLSVIPRLTDDELRLG